MPRFCETKCKLTPPQRYLFFTLNLAIRGRRKVRKPDQLPNPEKMGDDKVKKEALQIITQHNQNLPSLVVFDLDYTLWPFYCNFKDDTTYLYREALPILQALKEKGISMAVASRSPTPDVAKSFLQKLGISSLFVTQEIFKSRTHRTETHKTHKTEHFQRIHATTGVPFTSMLFFDDGDRNIHEVLKMGVTSILVGNGVNLEAFGQGLSEFSRKSASSSRRV